MSTAFDEALKLTMSPNISADGEFAEVVTYTKKTTGATRSIYAIIDRNPPDRIAGSEQAPTSPKMRAIVKNDATTGIAATELIDARDTITVAYRLGTTAKPYTIRLAPIMGTQDAATLTLELD
jgi:hypothetical protein